jgi:hypothetical protein
VIETKMWSGVITGSRNDNKWMQTKDGQVIAYYYNPIVQNRIHCNAVRRRYRGYKVKSIIVFVGNINVPRYGGVISENELVNYIMRDYNRIYNRGRIDI